MPGKKKSRSELLTEAATWCRDKEGEDKFTLGSPFRDSNNKCIDSYDILDNDLIIFSLI